MRLKSLMSVVLFIFCVGLVSAQVKYNKSNISGTDENIFKAAPVADGTNILGYSEKEVVKGDCLGFEGNGVSSHAIKLDKKMLAPFVGQKLSAVKIGLGGEVPDVNVFVREELKGNDVASTVIEKGQMSWNYAKFETPYIIPADKDLYVGYSYNHSGSMYVIGLESGVYAAGSCYLGFVGGGENYFDDLSASSYELGKLLIAAIIGEDVEAYGNSLTLDASSMPSIVQKNLPFSTKITVINTGWNEVSEASVYFREEANSVTKNVSFEPALQPGEIAECELNDLIVSTDQKVGFNVLTVNKAQNYATKSLLYVDCKVYDEEVYERNMLLEHYTGTWCSNCPDGVKMIKDLMEGNEDRFVWISYHIYLDEFCNEEGTANAVKFTGGGTAPIMMLNRTARNLMNPSGGSGIFALSAHPTLFAYTNNKENFVDAELAEPARVSVNISQSYDSEKNSLHITVSGKKASGYLDDKNLVLTVNILEDGQVAPQVGGSGDTVHDNILRDILSDMEGDALTFDEEGNYKMEYDFVIPDKYTSSTTGRITYPVRKNMKIAAFVSNKSDVLNQNNVFNVSQEKFISDVASDVEYVNDDSSVYGLYSQDGRIYVMGEASSLEIYNMSGSLLENNNLSAGIYLVKVVDNNGNIKIEKIFVR